MKQLKLFKDNFDIEAHCREILDRQMNSIGHNTLDFDWMVDFLTHRPYAMFRYVDGDSFIGSIERRID